jgi:glycyl-tRNA synthetase beta chain
MSATLLLEIGTEELPAGFVTGAVTALPGLIGGELGELRLAHGAARAVGTPRRLAVLVEGVEERQPDLDEEVVGPPSRVAFDAEGKPTKAALSFAGKLGCSVEDLSRRQTDKGEYIVGRRQEQGRPALELLPRALARVCAKIPFKKSMRWSDGDVAFGRPVRWLVGLLGSEPIAFEFAGLSSGRVSPGHRFLAPDAAAITAADSYLTELRERHVVADIEQRKRAMVERLREAAQAAGGVLIEDEFLVEENCSLVEEPQIVVGGFEREFLALPERVILDVAKGHQRYFGMRSQEGPLLPAYLAVVNTALSPDNIRRGNDRVMRARLADAKFFYDEDLKKPLGDRRAALDKVVFHKRLGSIGDKVRRIERLVGELGPVLSLPAAVVKNAQAGAALCKCDLVTLMVGELPELQGEMGRAYARVQGVDDLVARVISEHYQPRGADDATAPSEAGALVALADRLDTLTGCFAVGLVPTGAADPLALRRAAIGSLRTVLDKGWGLSLSEAIGIAYDGFSGAKLDQDEAQTQQRLGQFCEQRLRGVLTDKLPQDAVDACLAAGSDQPHDVALRAAALGAIAEDVRRSAGEVFKRAANIAKDAPKGEPRPPQEVQKDVPATESELFTALEALVAKVASARDKQDYAVALAAVAEFAPVLSRFFDDVLVMAEDPALRENRLRLMRKIQATCAGLAHFNLLAT